MGRFASPAAQGPQDVNPLTGANGVLQITRQRITDEEVHVGADAVLFVNHAEPDTGILRLKSSINSARFPPSAATSACPSV